MILLDGGAYTHVCPRNFAPEIPMVEARRHIGGLAANGGELVAEGTKTVSLGVWRGGWLRVTFFVMNILRPLLSVGQLQRQGWDANFSAHSSLRRGDRVVPLFRRGNLTFMPAVLPANKEWPTSVKMIMEYAVDAVKDKKDVVEDREPWHVMEYCCEKDSLLSEWFLGCGHAAARFGLPASDLRTRRAAEDVVRRVEQALDKGERVAVGGASVYAME